MSYSLTTAVFPSLNEKSVNSSPLDEALTMPSETFAFLPSETANLAISGSDSDLVALAIDDYKIIC